MDYVLSTGEVVEHRDKCHICSSLRSAALKRNSVGKGKYGHHDFYITNPAMQAWRDRKTQAGFQSDFYQAS